MTSPRIVVVGSGRSGTHSVAELLGGVHEPNQFRTVQAAWHYVHRTHPDPTVARILGDDWPEIVADFKLTELIPLLADVWPDCRFVFITRNARDTVASMIEKNWYLPADDHAQPAYLWWWAPEPWQDANYPGHRTRPDKLGLMSAEEWAQMRQPERCCWWWQHSVRVASQHLLDLPDRWWAGRLETLDVEGLASFAGVEPGVLPRLEASGARWHDGWEPHYRRWCKDLNETLGYG